MCLFLSDTGSMAKASVPMTPLEKELMEEAQNDSLRIKTCISMNLQTSITDASFPLPQEGSTREERKNPITTIKLP